MNSQFARISIAIIKVLFHYMSVRLNGRKSCQIFDKKLHTGTYYVSGLSGMRLLFQKTLVFWFLVIRTL